MLQNILETYHFSELLNLQFLSTLIKKSPWDEEEAQFLLKALPLSQHTSWSHILAELLEGNGTSVSAGLRSESASLAKSSHA